MQDLFYVIYDPRKDKYIDRDGGNSSFENAEQFQSYDAALDMWNEGPSYLRVVGPCIEGETP
jgi:hypothetical protein